MSTDTGLVHAFEFQDSLVLAQENNDLLLVLDPLAKYIWQSRVKGITKVTIAEQIAAAYNIPLSQALSDVESTIQQWVPQPEISHKKNSPATSDDKLRPTKISYPFPKPATEVIYVLPRFSLRFLTDTPQIARTLDDALQWPTADRTEKHDHTLAVLSTKTGYQIFVDGKAVGHADTERLVLVLALFEITELACHRENWLAILHAGGVAWGNRGIIMPTRGGAGKTTLTAVLVRKGFNYINDDVIPLHRNSRLLIPIPMSLCIKSGSWSILQPYYSQLSEIESYERNDLLVKYLPLPQSSWHKNAVPAAVIVVPEYRQGTSTTLKKISVVEALRFILHGESLLHRPLKIRDVESLLSWLADLPCYSLIYEDVDDAADILKTLI